VSFVIDGDTLLLDDGSRVRLIGVDTPETHDRTRRPELWGAEADAFTRAIVERGGGRVRLQFDDERLDKYQRYLAYVWIDGKLLNEELIRAGLGRFTPQSRARRLH
jgi:micrococcal nuclease